MQVGAHDCRVEFARLDAGEQVFGVQTTSHHAQLGAVYGLGEELQDGALSGGIADCDECPRLVDSQRSRRSDAVEDRLGFFPHGVAAPESSAGTWISSTSPVQRASARLLARSSGTSSVTQATGRLARSGKDGPPLLEDPAEVVAVVSVSACPTWSTTTRS